MKGSAGSPPSICISASRGLLGLKRLFHPLPRCCNGSPPAFISAGLMRRPLMSLTGKVAPAGGWVFGGGETPLQRFQTTFRVAANEGIGRAGARCRGCGSLRAGGAGLCPPRDVKLTRLWVTLCPAAKTEHLKPKKELTPHLVLLSHRLRLSPNHSLPREGEVCVPLPGVDKRERSPRTEHPAPREGQMLSTVAGHHRPPLRASSSPSAPRMKICTNTNGAPPHPPAPPSSRSLPIYPTEDGSMAALAPLHALLRGVGRPITSLLPWRGGTAWLAPAVDSPAACWHRHPQSQCHQSRGEGGALPPQAWGCILRTSTAEIVSLQTSSAQTVPGQGSQRSSCLSSPLRRGMNGGCSGEVAPLGLVSLQPPGTASTSTGGRPCPACGQLSPAPTPRECSGASLIVLTPSPPR